MTSKINRNTLEYSLIIKSEKKLSPKPVINSKIKILRMINGARLYKCRILCGRFCNLNFLKKLVFIIRKEYRKPNKFINNNKVSVDTTMLCFINYSNWFLRVI